MNNICDASYGLFINNEFVPSSDGKTFATVCPANGEKLADVRSEEHTSELQSPQ